MSKGTKKGRNFKMESRKFTDHKYAQAQINTYPNGSRALQSYDTIVIEIDPESWLLVNGLYSPTTKRHIGWFMRELYGLTYYIAKECWVNDKEYNVLTGEWRELA